MLKKFSFNKIIFQIYFSSNMGLCGREKEFQKGRIENEINVNQILHYHYFIVVAN